MPVRQRQVLTAPECPRGLYAWSDITLPGFACSDRLRRKHELRASGKSQGGWLIDGRHSQCIALAHHCWLAALQAWLGYGLGAHNYVRQLVNTILISVWGFRLGMYLLVRVIKRGHDAR